MNPGGRGKPAADARDLQLVSTDAATELMCLRNLLGDGIERIYFKDRESRFLMVSAGWLTSYGHGRALGDIVGRTDFDVFSAEHAAKAYADEQQIMATDKPLIGRLERETFVGRPDEWVSTTKLPLRDADGETSAPMGRPAWSPSRSRPRRRSSLRDLTTRSPDCRTGRR